MFGSLENSAYLCIRFWEQRFSRAKKERVLWKTYINREVVQEASYIIIYSVIRVKDTNRQFEKIESLLWASIIREWSKSTEQTRHRCVKFRFTPWRKEIFLQWRVWSWLRMNASYRLNTCKSRGSSFLACQGRWRPAHGWVTRIQPSLVHGIARRKAD